MKKRADPEQIRKCQKDFNSPLPIMVQSNLRMFSDMRHQYHVPPNDSLAWDFGVQTCALIMGHYLEDCPAGKSWENHTKLTNILEKTTLKTTS